MIEELKVVVMPTSLLMWHLKTFVNLSQMNP